jgi:hypothetical protein
MHTHPCMPTWHTGGFLLVLLKSLCLVFNTITFIYITYSALLSCIISLCIDLFVFLYRTLILGMTCFRNLQSLSLNSTWRYLSLHALSVPDIFICLYRLSVYLIIYFRPDIQMVLHWMLFLFILLWLICSILLLVMQLIMDTGIDKFHISKVNCDF